MTEKIYETKYYKLKEYLKNEILLGNIKPGGQIPSENTLAEKFSLSRHTVRKSISMLASEEYLYTEHGRGTFCIDRMGRNRNSKNIGVITTYISEYIFPGVIQGIDKVLSKNGYSIMLKSTGNDTSKEAECIKDMLQKDITGLIIEPTRSSLFSNNIPLYESLDRHGIPYLFIHGYFEPLKDKPHVVMDDAAGMFSITEYLTSLGHRNIVGIFKADDIQGINRHRGYVKALSARGIAYNPDNVIWFHTEDKNTKPYAVIKNMIANSCIPDSIVCYNDEIAFKMVEIVTQAGLKVPSDISVTGYDDSHLAVACPVKLTTAAHPKQKLGEAAAGLMLDIINNTADISLQIVFSPELVIRDSCI